MIASVAGMTTPSARATTPANLRLFISSSPHLIADGFDYVISWNYIPVCPTYADCVQRLFDQNRYCRQCIFVKMHSDTLIHATKSSYCGRSDRGVTGRQTIHDARFSAAKMVERDAHHRPEEC